jgi:heme exporter protein C
VGTLFWAVVMVTGPRWARKSWGTFWTFDPRLTTFLLVGMIFIAYLMLRNLGATGRPSAASLQGSRYWVAR